WAKARDEQEIARLISEREACCAEFLRLVDDAPEVDPAPPIPHRHVPWSERARPCRIAAVAAHLGGIAFAVFLTVRVTATPLPAALGSVFVYSFWATLIDLGLFLIPANWFRRHFVRLYWLALVFTFAFGVVFALGRVATPE